MAVSRLLSTLSDTWNSHLVCSLGYSKQAISTAQGVQQLLELAYKSTLLYAFISVSYSSHLPNSNRTDLRPWYLPNQLISRHIGMTKFTVNTL